MYLSLIPLPLIYGLAGIFGAIIGSFLNVVVHRLPREESIAFPSSRCPSCGAKIAFYDNVPVLSYLILRGRCRSCNVPISARYPAVEALTAFLWIAAVWRDGLTFELPFDLVFVTAITALIFINAEHMLLPNAITYPGIVFALIAHVALPYLMDAPHLEDLRALLNDLPPGMPLIGGPSTGTFLARIWNARLVWGISLLGSLFGALVGGGHLWLIGWAWQKMRGVEAIGLGNVKMMSMVGAYLGWRLTILNIFLSWLFMIGIGIVMVLQVGKRGSEMPSGVFFGVGAIVSMLVGSQIIEWCVSQYG